MRAIEEREGGRERGREREGTRRRVKLPTFLCLCRLLDRSPSYCPRPFCQCTGSPACVSRPPSKLHSAEPQKRPLALKREREITSPALLCRSLALVVLSPAEDTLRRLPYTAAALAHFSICDAVQMRKRITLFLSLFLGRSRFLSLFRSLFLALLSFRSTADDAPPAAGRTSALHGCHRRCSRSWLKEGRRRERGSTAAVRRSSVPDAVSLAMRSAGARLSVLTNRREEVLHPIVYTRDTQE